MEKKDIIEFFDRCAPTWDAGMIKSDAIMARYLTMPRWARIWTFWMWPAVPA